MKSIRSRLLVALLGGIAFVVACSYVFIYLYVASALREQYDSELRRKINAFALMGEQEDGPDEDESDAEYNDFGDDSEDLVRFEFAEIPLTEYQPAPKPEYYQVWDEKGVVLARSPSLGGGDLPRAEAPPAGVRLEDIVLPDTRRGRMATARITPKIEGAAGAAVIENSRLVLSLARSTEELHATLGVLFMGLLGAGFTAIALASILIWTSVKRGLRPLDDISAEIESLGPDDLEHRFDEENKPSELQAISRRLNRLLGRLREAFGRERRFTSDVAHELRTPIAELRALAEVSLKREHANESDRRSFRDTLDIARHMERIISSLLEIARCASGQVALTQRPLNLNTLVESAWKPFAEDAKAKGLAVHLGINGRRELNTDPVLLEAILSNLFSNAVAYTPNGGEVQLSMKEEQAWLSLTLSNTTGDLTQDDLAHIFDTFWRKDSSLDDALHSGVGLSLVAALAGVLGVAVETGMPSRGVFQITLRHPV